MPRFFFLLLYEIYNVYIPTVFKIELIKIAIRMIGATHLITTVNKVLLLKVAPSAFASSMIVFGLMTNPTKKQVSSATIGIKILLLMKSHASKIDIPSGWMKSQIPNPREDGIPIKRQ